ncbi:MAG: alpha/beta hydrolase-fold protein [Victivallaceae bacterium]
MKRLMSIVVIFLAAALTAETFTAQTPPWPGLWIWGARRDGTPPVRVNLAEYLAARPGGWNHSLVNRIVGDLAAGGIGTIYWELNDGRGKALFPAADPARVLRWPNWGMDLGEIDYPGLAAAVAAKLGIDFRLAASEEFLAEAKAKYPNLTVIPRAEIPPAALSASSFEANAAARKYLDRRTFVFEKHFTLATRPESARLLVSANRQYEVELNGKTVGRDGDWMRGETYQVGGLLKPGDNLLRLKVEPDADLAGVVAALEYSVNGKTEVLATDLTFRAKAADEKEFHGVIATGFEGAGPRFRLKEPWSNPTPNYFELIEAEPASGETASKVRVFAENFENPAGLKLVQGTPQATVVETGDDRFGKALRIALPEKSNANHRFELPPLTAGQVTVDFDFLVRSSAAGTLTVAAVAGGKGGNFAEQSLAWLMLDGKRGVLCSYQNGWKDAGSFRTGEWNHLQMNIHLSGKRAGTIDLALNGDTGVLMLPFRNPLTISAQLPLDQLYLVGRAAGRDGGDVLLDNLVVASSGVAAPTPPATERVRAEKFFSAALNKEKAYTVLLPAGFDPGRSYPVLFLLHGRGRNQNSLIDSPRAFAALKQAKFITVLPLGDDSWYINSPVKKGDRYSDYLAEVIADAEKKYPVSRDRRFRGLAGWSMGGYGAAMFAESHPDSFSLLATAIALLDFPRAESDFPEKQRYKVPVERFGEDPALWRDFNPATGAAKLRDFKVILVLGKQDFACTMNRNFLAALEAAKIPATVIELPGGHAFATVEAAVEKIVPLVNQYFER